MIEARNVSCCLITKAANYPIQILEWLAGIGFGETLILTNCDSQHRKQELFAKAKFDYLYYQDDDCLAPARAVLQAAEPGKITCAMKPGHMDFYRHLPIALLGWGSIFPKSVLKTLDLYREKYGEDDVFRREDTRILTCLNYPQKRIDLPIVDLPSATAPDRLSMQPDHLTYIPLVLERCAELTK